MCRRCFYVSEREVTAAGKKLNSRFSSSKTVRNTRTLHYFEPLDTNTMKVKLYSFDSNSQTVSVT